MPSDLNAPEKPSSVHCVETRHASGTLTAPGGATVGQEDTITVTWSDGSQTTFVQPATVTTAEGQAAFWADQIDGATADGDLVQFRYCGFSFIYPTLFEFSDAGLPATTFATAGNINISADGNRHTQTIGNANLTIDKSGSASAFNSAFPGGVLGFFGAANAATARRHVITVPGAASLTVTFLDIDPGEPFTFVTPIESVAGALTQTGQTVAGTVTNFGSGTVTVLGDTMEYFHHIGAGGGVGIVSVAVPDSESPPVPSGITFIETRLQRCIECGSPAKFVDPTTGDEVPEPECWWPCGNRELAIRLDALQQDVSEIRNCVEDEKETAYAELEFTASSGPDLNTFRTVASWGNNLTGTAEIDQIFPGVNATAGPNVEPLAPWSFPDQDPNFPNLPYYDAEPPFQPGTVRPTLDASGNLQLTDFTNGGDPNDHEKWIGEFYLTLPPGCVSGAETVQFQVRRIVGRGLTALYVAQGHNPADAQFEGTHHRAGNPYPGTNYNHPGSQVYPLNLTDVNRFYFRLYNIDGKEATTGGAHDGPRYPARAYNPIVDFRYDGGSYQQIAAGDYAADPQSVNASAELGQLWKCLGGVCWLPDGTTRPESELQANPKMLRIPTTLAG